MPKETSYTKLRQDAAAILDRVIEDREVVTIRRRGGRNVALIPVLKRGKRNAASMEALRHNRGNIGRTNPTAG